MARFVGLVVLYCCRSVLWGWWFKCWFLRFGYGFAFGMRGFWGLLVMLFGGLCWFVSHACALSICVYFVDCGFIMFTLGWFGWFAG